MRRTIIFFVFIAVSLVANAQLRLNEFHPVIPNNSYSTYQAGQRRSSSQLRLNEYTPVVPESVVVGKTYNAIIFYESSAGTENTYELPVVVNNGSVQKICFNNGGSLHVGHNNTGYEYYGGKLEYVKDIDAYVTAVTVVYSSSSWQRFTIVIQ